MLRHRTEAPGAALSLTRSTYPSLSPAEQRVADYVLEHPEEVIYFSVTELAEASGVGESTVIRFCQSVGFRGYQEFKLSLAREQVSDRENVTGHVDPLDDLPTLVQKLTFANARAVEETANLLAGPALERAVEALLRARKIDFYGVGASGATALDAKYKFLRIGKVCDALTDGHLQAMSAALLGPEDVAVGFSHSGSTKDVVESMRLASQAGATTIGITSYARSPLAEVVHICLLTATRETPLGSGALRSKIAQLHVLDVLFTAVTLRLGDTALANTKITAEAVLDKLY